MKQLIEVLAVYLDKMKTKNPLTFVGVTIVMLGSILVLDSSEYCQANYAEGFTKVKYLLIVLTGFSGSHTTEHLSKSQAKKTNTNEQN